MTNLNKKRRFVATENEMHQIESAVKSGKSRLEALVDFLGFDPSKVDSSEMNSIIAEFNSEAEKLSNRPKGRTLEEIALNTKRLSETKSQEEISKMIDDL